MSQGTNGTVSNLVTADNASDIGRLQFVINAADRKAHV